MIRSRATSLRARGGRGSAAATALALALGFTLATSASAVSAPDTPAPEGTTASPTPEPTSSPSPTPDPDPDADPAVTLTLTDLAPAVAQAQDTLVLTGTITNTTHAPFVNPTLRIGKQQSVPNSRLALDRWFDPATGPGARTMVTSTYEVSVAPGETVPFSTSVAVADLAFPIRTDNWGARGLEVSLTGGGETAIARTVGVFHPDEPVVEPSLQISAVLPLTASASEWTSAIESGVPVEEVAGPRIHELVDATGSAVSWALDPALIDVESAEADTLQEHLTSAAGDRDIIALPWADADVSALGGAGEEGTTLLTDARRASNEAFASVGLQVSTTTAWPAAPGTSQESVRIADRAGYTSLVLDGVAAPDPDLTATASARVNVSGTAAGMPAAVSESYLTSAVAGVAPAGSGSMSTQLASRQYALALSAVITRESNAPRTLVVTADRALVGALGTGEGESVSDFGDRLSALLAAPWVTPIGVDDVLLQEPTDALRDSLPLRLDVTSPTFTRALTSASEGIAQVAQLRSALEHPEVLDDVAGVFATTTASAWRVDEANPKIASDAGWAQLEPFATAVTVSVPASLVDVFAQESAVPLTLTNTLDQALTVDVRAVPDQPGLRVEEVPRHTIAPGESIQVKIPMVALANGQTSMTVDVLTPDGATVGPGETFNLRVRAEWETVGTGIVVAGLAVLLVVGLIRTFRRGRRDTDGNAPGTVPEVEPSHPSEGS